MPILDRDSSCVPSIACRLEHVAYLHQPFLTIQPWLFSCNLTVALGRQKHHISVLTMWRNRERGIWILYGLQTRFRNWEKLDASSNPAVLCIGYYQGWREPSSISGITRLIELFMRSCVDVGPVPFIPDCLKPWQYNLTYTLTTGCHPAHPIKEVWKVFS